MKGDYLSVIEIYFCLVIFCRPEKRLHVNALSAIFSFPLNKRIPLNLQKTFFSVHVRLFELSGPITGPANEDDFPNGPSQQKRNEFSNGPGWQKRTVFFNEPNQKKKKKKKKKKKWRQIIILLVSPSRQNKDKVFKLAKKRIIKYWT